MIKFIVKVKCKDFVVFIFLYVIDENKVSNNWRWEGSRINCCRVVYCCWSREVFRDYRYRFVLNFGSF